MKNIRASDAARAAWLMLALLAAGSFAPAARAQSADPAAVGRADTFLKTEKRGRFICGYVHAGAQYKGHSYVGTTGVVNRPGHVALIYKYRWESDGVTDLAFLCDPKGNVYEVQVVKTNAVLQQPYVVANGTIQVLGNVLIQAFRNQMTPQDLKQAQQLVDNADARGLMELGLRLQQTFGQ